VDSCDWLCGDRWYDHWCTSVPDLAASPRFLVVVLLAFELPQSPTNRGSERIQVINNPEVKALYESWGKRLIRINDLIRVHRKNRSATKEQLVVLKNHRKKINGYRSLLESDRNLTQMDPSVVIAQKLVFQLYEMP
jgi:hypothetical protein